MVDDSDIIDATEEAYHSKRSSILGETSVLVFGPSSGSDGFNLRELIRATLRNAGTRANYAEEILQNSRINASIAEEILATQYHLVYVLLSGPGTVAEFSSFVRVPTIATKFRIFQDAKFTAEKSFLNQVLKPFCDMYRFCFSFSNESELVEAVNSCLEAYVQFVLAFRFRP